MLYYNPVQTFPPRYIIGYLHKQTNTLGMYHVLFDLSCKVPLSTRICRINHENVKLLLNTPFLLIL